jgi:hypothetical protein
MNAPTIAVGAFLLHSQRGPSRVAVGGALPSIRIGDGNTYGCLVGSSTARVGSGVTIAIVGIGVGVPVCVGVGVVDGVGLGWSVLVAVGSTVESSTSDGARVGDSTGAR